MVENKRKTGVLTGVLNTKYLIIRVIGITVVGLIPLYYVSSTIKTK